MRHVLLIAVAALGIAIALVLVVGEEEAGEDAPPGTVSVTEDVSPGSGTEPAPERPAPKRSGEVKQVEEAVTLYVEAVERGEIVAPGLPTTDEFSIEQVRIQDERATVRLAGGARLVLRRGDGSWRVVRARPGPIPAPTPPSNGP